MTALNTRVTKEAKERWVYKPAKGKKQSCTVIFWLVAMSQTPLKQLSMPAALC